MVGPGGSEDHVALVGADKLAVDLVDVRLLADLWVVARVAAGGEGHVDRLVDVDLADAATGEDKQGQTSHVARPCAARVPLPTTRNRVAGTGSTNARLQTRSGTPRRVSMRA